MFRQIISAVLLFVCAFTIQAQTKESYFPKSELMKMGVYYYPEAWDPSQWERDISNIKKLGFEFIHMSEFAWAMMEPEEGKYDFEWLERAVKLAGKYDLKVVLCTPSATPPVWLVRKHPEVLMIASNGQRMNHGGRQHASWSSPVYRNYVEKIVTELGKRFGNNPNVIGWQIDNELSHYWRNYSYDNAARDKFRVWLKAKYKTIGALNRDWGTSFWSQIYQNFEQIDIPNQAEQVAQVNPHAQTDFQRWFADNAADYLRFQAAVLRRYTRNQWITTNYMPAHNPINPPLNKNDFEIITSTIYPVNGETGEQPLRFRMGDGTGLSFDFSFMRNINGTHGVMEMQPGQVNWAAVNPLPHPNAVYLWIMTSFAAKSQLLCTYRYRQPLYGGELYHHGIVGTDGVTLSNGGREFVKAVNDIKKLRESSRINAPEPVEYSRRRTGFLFNRENIWNISVHPQTNRWRTAAHLQRYYNALKTFGAPVEVITDEAADFSKYPFLVAPAYQLVDEKLVSRWTEYVQNGGHLILTARTAHKDKRGHLWEGKWSALILPLIGAEIETYDILPGNLKGKVQANGKVYEWETWGEQLKPDSATTTLATYSDQFYAGTPAATTRKLGKGTVTYIGVDSSNGTLEKDLLRDVFIRAGIAVANYPEQIIIEWRDGFWIATNFWWCLKFYDGLRIDCLNS